MKPWKHLPVLYAVFVSGLCLPAFASSQFYVYNSFGPANSYNTSTSWGVEGTATTGGYRGQAEWFVPGTSGFLSSIQVALSYHGGTGLVNFHVTQDNGGIPGTVLESFANVPSPGTDTMNSVAQPLLHAGTKYWLTAEPDGDTTDLVGWYFNNQGYANGFAFERSTGAWQFFFAPPPNQTPSSGVFSISVTAVPEPSIAVLALALGAIPLIRRAVCGV